CLHIVHFFCFLSQYSWLYFVSCFDHFFFFFFSSRRRHTRFSRDWSSDVCSSDLTIQRSLLACSSSRCLRMDQSRKPSSFISMERGFSPSAMDNRPSRIISWYRDCSSTTALSLAATGSRKRLARATP